MKLVSAPDGTVDRLDRALWLTGPFDKPWLSAVGKAPGHALSPLVGWLGRALLAEGPHVGSVLRRAALAVSLGITGAEGATAVQAGALGRGASAGAVGIGVMERAALAEGPTTGSY